MAQQLTQWVSEVVNPIRKRSVRWLSERYFFRDPMRPIISDWGYFFAPADGVIIYQKKVGLDDAVVEIKGKNYTLREAMREPSYDAEESLV